MITEIQAQQLLTGFLAFQSSSDAKHTTMVGPSLCSTALHVTSAGQDTVEQQALQRAKVKAQGSDRVFEAEAEREESTFFLRGALPNRVSYCQKNKPHHGTHTHSDTERPARFPYVQAQQGT